jgi:hypothetical protein
MTRKTTLPWDLEHAMTAFQVDPRWYEKHWLTPEEPSRRRSGTFAMLSARFRRGGPSKAHDPLSLRTSGSGDICRRADGSIDINYYRRKAAQDWEQAKRDAVVSSIAQLRRTCLSVTSTLRLGRLDYHVFSHMKPGFRGR